MRNFNERACNVTLEGTTPKNQTCSKAAHALWIYNVLPYDSYAKEYELKICDLETPTANIQNFALRLYDRNLNKTSVFLNATVPLMIVPPTFSIVSQKLTSEVCGAPFEQSLKIKFPASLRLDSTFSVKFKFSESYFPERELLITSQALDLKTKHAITKNAKGYFEYLHSGEPIWFTEIDLQITGLRNPLTPGQASFMITLGFDNLQSIVSNLTISNAFLYNAVNGLALNVSNATFIDLQNLEISFSELLYAPPNTKFRVQLSFENCLSWSEFSRLQIKNADVNTSSLAIDTQKYALQVNGIELTNQKENAVSLKQLRINKDFSRPSKLTISLYNKDTLAYVVVHQLTSSQNAIRGGQMLVEQVGDLFELTLFLTPTVLMSGNLTVQIGSINQRHINMGCQIPESVGGSMKNCTRNSSDSTMLQADFAALDPQIQPKIVLSIEKNTLNITEENTISFEFYISDKQATGIGNGPIYEQIFVSIEYELLKSCKTISIQSNTCVICAAGYELDSSTRRCKILNLADQNSQRKLFSINMVLDDFLKKIYSGICFNLFAMIFILSFVFKVLFAHNFDWLHFHGVFCKLIWLVISYAYLIIIAITFDTDKLRHLIFIAIHLSINTLVSVVFFVKLLALFGSRLWIGQSSFTRIMFAFVIVLSGTSPILFMKSFRDRFVYLEYLVGPDLQNSYKTLWKYMNWYSVIFHLASLSCILALLVPIKFDQMVAFLLLTCFNIALNSLLLIIQSRGAKKKISRQFTGVLGSNEKQLDTEVSEIETLIKLECEGHIQHGNPVYSASDYLPLKSVFEKLQSFKHFENQEF
jgi:hypothetical protein